MRMRQALITSATLVAVGCGSSPQLPTIAPTEELAASVPDETVPAGTRFAISFDTDLGPGLDVPGDVVRGKVLTRLVDRDGDEVVPYGASWEGRVEGSDLAARTVTIRFERVMTRAGWTPFAARVVSAAPYAHAVEPNPRAEELAPADVTVLLGRAAGQVAIGGGPPAEGVTERQASRPRTLMTEIVVPARTAVDVSLVRPLKLP